MGSIFQLKDAAGSGSRLVETFTSRVDMAAGLVRLGASRLDMFLVGTNLQDVGDWSYVTLRINGQVGAAVIRWVV